MDSSEQLQNNSPAHSRLILLVLVILGTVTALLFWPATNSAFVNFDDTEYVTENYHIQQGITAESIAWAFRSNHAGNWHPLTWVSHMIDFDLYGLSPGGHHFTNLLLHVANTLLLFLVLKRATSTLWRSALVAALFAWHPMHVESVAWVSERKDVLSTFFAMLTMWTYTFYASPETQTKIAPADIYQRSQRGGICYLLALICFLLGLMSKPMLVTLPFVLLLLDVWPLKRLPVEDLRPAKICLWVSQYKRVFLEKLPFLALSGMASTVTFLVQKKAGAVAGDPMLYRVATAFRGYMGYVAKLLWPAKLAAFYPLPDSIPALQTVVAALGLCGITLLVLSQARRFPYLLTGWLWFAGTLVPVIGIVQVGSQAMADRYSYIPSIGFFIAIIWLAAEFLRNRLVAVVLGAVVLCSCALATLLQVSYWKDSVALFSRVVAVNGESDLGHVQIGTALSFCGRPNEAIAEFKKALTLNPKDDAAQMNWGLTLLSQEKFNEAIPHLKEAVRQHPITAKNYDYLGVALARTGNYSEAEKEMETALKLDPNNAAAHLHAGFVFMREKQENKAISELSRALELNPLLQEAHVYLGHIYLDRKDFDKAIQHCIAAIRLKPDDLEAQRNLQVVAAERDRLSTNHLAMPKN